MPIAAVERETGLSKDTLRVWERRYGFPVPLRDRRGERQYPSEQVEKLRVISRLLDRGMRPGELMRIPLATLIGRFHSSEPVPQAASREAPWGALAACMREAIEWLKAGDEAALRAHLSRALLRLGLQRFVIELAAPLNELVGEAWSRGEIAIGQEHVYTEQMQHLLRAGTDAVVPGEGAPRVMLTTPPGEEHQLGLLMAQVCLLAEGAHCISLGVQTPAGAIADSARRHGIDVVGLSFSEALRLKVAHDMLEELRERLPAKIELWAGGKLWARARRPPKGVRFVTRLTQIPDLLAAHRQARAGRRLLSRPKSESPDTQPEQ
jgi:methylmalonyl-CoA mutase cobalamin-binding subunit